MATPHPSQQQLSRSEERVIRIAQLRQQQTELSARLSSRKAPTVQHWCLWVLMALFAPALARQQAQELRHLRYTLERVEADLFSLSQLQEEHEKRAQEAEKRAQEAEVARKAEQARLRQEAQTRRQQAEHTRKQQEIQAQEQAHGLEQRFARALQQELAKVPSSRFLPGGSSQPSQQQEAKAPKAAPARKQSERLSKGARRKLARTHHQR